MRNKILFALAILGLLGGLVSAYIFGIEKKPQQPAFTPASNPFGNGIYANGIIESYQSNGENINLYPEVPGTITNISVAEGESVQKGKPLLVIDDSVQRAATEQQRAQAEAALAQIGQAEANLKSVQDQLDKQKKSFSLEPRSVSKDALDNAENAALVAKATLEVARKQYQAANKAYQASNSLLSKYTLKAPADGVVMAINAAVGSYISSQGSYDTYTGGLVPVIAMGGDQLYYGVRCYIDEILVQRLPSVGKVDAKMFIRGTDVKIPLEFVRVQPYVSPKIQLSDQRSERVDVRVLPVIFRFAKPENLSLYPGQLVDVYIGEK
jgi:HlyD family secretion protein